MPCGREVESLKRVAMPLKERTKEVTNQGMHKTKTKM
jgi:hypothetical protein